MTIQPSKVPRSSQHGRLPEERPQVFGTPDPAPGRREATAVDQRLAVVLLGPMPCHGNPCFGTV